jgi:triacylglycerol lipase
MRGARGIEFGVDLPALPGIGRGGNDNGSGDGWGLKDWGRFVGAWRKEEKIQRDAATAASKAADQGGVQASLSGKDRQRERERQREKDDAVIKSSTDKLSAVFDWLVDQVPIPPSLGAKGKLLADKEVRTSHDVAGIKEEPTSEMKKHIVEDGKGRKQNELATKMDLERFYVALSRNLYDVGL